MLACDNSDKSQMRAIQSNYRRHNLSPELDAVIESIKKTATKPGIRSARFNLYEFLEAIYRVYVDWKRSKIAKKSASALANQIKLFPRKGMSPIRTLIEATLPDADFKQKSRWVRALEYVYSEDVAPSRFRRFVGGHGGVAGCARLAVEVSRKRRRPGGDWN
jgi:hypothetical protein